MRCDIMVDLGGYIYPESDDNEEEPDELAVIDPLVAALILFTIVYASASSINFNSLF